MEIESEEGLVNEYFPLKGFGFIRRKKGRDVFFFYADLIDSDRLVDVGDRVSFNVEPGKKGPKAVKIKKLGSAH
jgi:CspA family cold shock protein